MSEYKSAPQIRFKGFSDAWEQRKLGECFVERKESMPNGELISVTINDGIKKFSELNRHDNSNENKSKYKKVCVGDIAYNSMRMWQGASGFSPYEGIVSPAYTILSPIKDAVDSKCISYLFKRQDMLYIFQKNSQGITSDNWNLKYPALSNIEIKVSNSIIEQKKIATFLSNLDNLITLHQRKYNCFSNSWEQRKLEEISNRFDNLRVPVSANEREKGTTPYYGANGIQDYVKGFTHNGEYVLIAEDGANDLKNYPVKYVNGLFWANNHVHVVQGKEGICDNKYLKYCFTKTNIESLLVGGGRAKLNANIMMGIELTVPSFNEQVELGRMFYELDNLITLHQRKLEKLNELKKSMLDKMFI